MVSEVSVDAMLDALEKCLEMANSYGLEHFGLLAPPSEDDEDEYDKQANTNSGV